MNITPEQRDQIESSLRQKYEKVAAGLAGQFRYPTGEKGLEALGYLPDWYSHLPESVRGFYHGVGNPFVLGIPAKGWRVLDVGAGCGLDTLMTAGFVGSQGLALGLESSPAMLAKARENAQAAEVESAEFIHGNAEALPFEDAAFELITSNGVYNLVIDKAKALAEAYRVLKPGGWLQVADQMLTGPSCMTQSEMVASWFT